MKPAAAGSFDAIDDRMFEPMVFFVRVLGFITRTEARRIDLTEASRFEKVHEATYRQFGFDLLSIEPGSIADRVAAIRAAL